MSVNLQIKFLCLLAFVIIGEASIGQPCNTPLLPAPRLTMTQVNSEMNLQLNTLFSIPGFVGCGIGKVNAMTGKSAGHINSPGILGVSVWLEDQTAVDKLIQIYGSNPFQVNGVWFHAEITGRMRAQ